MGPDNLEQNEELGEGGTPADLEQIEETVPTDAEEVPVNQEAAHEEGSGDEEVPVHQENVEKGAPAYQKRNEEEEEVTAHQESDEEEA